MASADQEAASDPSVLREPIPSTAPSLWPSYWASKVGGTSSSHRSPSLLQHGALHSPVLYSAPPRQRVKCDPTRLATRDTRDNMGKAGDWTLALALSLTDPGHVSLLGLSPGQSNGESGDLSSLASAGALVPFGPGAGCPQCVGPYISVTGPGEQEGQNCSLGKCCHRGLRSA